MKNLLNRAASVSALVALPVLALALTACGTRKADDQEAGQAPQGLPNNTAGQAPAPISSPNNNNNGNNNGNQNNSGTPAQNSVVAEADLKMIEGTYSGQLQSTSVSTQVQSFYMSLRRCNFGSSTYLCVEFKSPKGATGIADINVQTAYMGVFPESGAYGPTFRFVSQFLDGPFAGVGTQRASIEYLYLQQHRRAFLNLRNCRAELQGPCEAEVTQVKVQNFAKTGN